MARNELLNAASPYLLQHQNNPVHWREWSPDALAEAQAAGKPILLSVGYAACHWCHVMAHESFEDESTAEIMNALFVNIKVDREERPDIDQIYMAALHALGQPGGWPLTMFLTPKGEPFWGGTYFPREASYGRPSFKQVLSEVARSYRETPEKIDNNVQALQQALTATTSKLDSGIISNTTLDEFARRLYPHMDSVNGGLQGSPKFPNCQILELFLRASERTGDLQFQKPVFTALTQMIRGGIHDHVGGGFARYAVDERWFVPHFEKMLYDNAQLLELLSIGWAQSRNVVFRNAAESMVDWLQREMLTENGAFAASLDADSEGVEGKYYCWTAEEIADVLNPDDARLFAGHYDVQPEGNWQEAHTGARSNVLNRLHDDDLSAETEARLAPLRAKLLKARETRIPPLRDDKILTDWNAMMICALARASYAFGKNEWLALASTAFRTVFESMAREDIGFLRLAHSYRAGKHVWPGMASDYVFMIRAALMLQSYNELDHQQAGALASSYIQIAKRLTDSLLEFHAEPESGILSLPASDSKDVVYRTFNTTDDATPNPNAIHLQNLHVLSAVTTEARYFEAGGKIAKSILPAALKNPFGHASFLNAIDGQLNGEQVVVVGQDVQNLIAAAQDATRLGRFVLALDDAAIRAGTRFEPGRDAQNGTAYICKGQECSLPLTTPEAIDKALGKRA